jgi:hypothetical protein
LSGRVAGRPCAARVEHIFDRLLFSRGFGVVRGVPAGLVRNDREQVDVTPEREPQDEQVSPEARLQEPDHGPTRHQRHPHPLSVAPENTYRLIAFFRVQWLGLDAQSCNGIVW